MSFKHPAPALRHPSISLRMADGGQVSPWSIKGMASRVQGAFTDSPEEAAKKTALAEYKARAAAERAGPAPAAAPAPQTAAPMGSQSVIDRRMAAAGLQDGGEVPGQGKGDKIPALYEPGEFVVSNAMLKARPSLRDELHELREGVLESQGKTVEEADANAVKTGPSLRALDGFEVKERPMTSADSRLFAQQPGPGNPNVPAGGSTDARAFQASRAPTVPAPATPAAAPAAPITARSVGSSLRNAVPSRPVANAGLAAGAALATTADSAQTPTENYYRRLNMDPSDRSVGKDVLARGVGVMSDFGAGLLDIPVGVANTVSRAFGGKGDMTLPGGNFGDILRRQDGEGGTPTDSVGAPVANSPTVQQPAVAPKPSLRADAPAAEPTPASTGNVNVTRQANGNLSFSGKDVTGDVTYGGPAGSSLRANPIGVVPAMDRRAVDAALNNPNGTRWSEGDNAIMAANLRDGVDPYRGTSRAQNTGDPALQQMEALASSPVGTPGRNGAIRAMIALKGDQTVRRGQDMTYDASMTGTRASIESNRARMNYDMSKDQRDFKMRDDEQAFKQRAEADKNLTAELESQFTTRDKDGNTVVDRNAVAEHKAAITSHMESLITAAEKRGDAATANALRKEGVNALGKDGIQKMVSQLELKKRAAAGHGNLPWSGRFVGSTNPADYEITGKKKGILWDSYTTRNGSEIDTKQVDYTAGGSNFLPNDLVDTRTTRFNNIKSLRQE